MKFFLPTLFLLLSVLVAIECQNKRFSYESVNFPGYFLHVRGGNLIWIDKFTPANPQKFIQEASFVLVPGLADNSKSDLISLMSMSKPNYYLTVQNSGKPAKMVESTGDNNFNRDATFILRKGLAKRPEGEDIEGNRYISFESYSVPDHFLRHKENGLEVILDQVDGTAEFHEDATFWERKSITQF